MHQKMRNKLSALLVALSLIGGGLAEGKQASKVRASSEGVVNINTASEQQLCLLPQIGPSKARAIIKYRMRKKFKGTWDLVRVKGIGRKTFSQLRPYLATQGETTLTTRPQVKKDKK